MLQKQKHRRQPRKHEMPNASKTIADRLMALRKQLDLEYSFPAENARYDYAREIGIGHDH